MKRSARAVDFGRALTPDFGQKLTPTGAAPAMPSVFEPRDFPFLVLDEPIEQRSRQLWIAEHTGPLAEGEMGDHDDEGTLI